ncbi:MAG: hypothetical protein KDJ88_05385, partial [Bauldia sp.]|nr:hypothetical protein [Bauldia sp.]
DLKPDNIILRNNSQPVIIDLGIARLKGLVDTVAGLGTERYAPPEQMSGSAVEDRWLGREDIYALGRMLGEMLEGGDEPQQRGGLLGRFGRRRAEPSGDALQQVMATMTVSDIARRDVDLNRLADLLDEAAIEAGS